MKIKNKPKKPERMNICHKILIKEDMPLAELLEIVKEKKADDGYFVLDVVCQDDIGEMKLEYFVEETDEAYNIRLEKYKKDLEKYNRWYNKNKEAIEEALARRKAKRKQEKKRILKEMEKST